MRSPSTITGMPVCFIAPVPALRSSQQFSFLFSKIKCFIYLFFIIINMKHNAHCTYSQNFENKVVSSVALPLRKEEQGRGAIPLHQTPALNTVAYSLKLSNSHVTSPSSAHTPGYSEAVLFRMSATPAPNTFAYTAYLDTRLFPLRLKGKWVRVQLLGIRCRSWGKND